MINSESANMYSEVYEVIQKLGEQYINKIPKKLYVFIEENRNKNYKPVYDIKRPLSNQKIGQNTASFICMLHYNYWCNSEKEKNEIKQVLSQNELDYEKTLYKYKEKWNDSGKEDLKKEVAIIEIKTEKWYNKVLNLFKRLFKRKN